MKKLRTLGIVTGVFTLFAAAALALAAIFGVFDAEKAEGLPSDGEQITVTPEELSEIQWQTSFASGGKTAVIVTNEGEIEICLAPNAAGEKFAELALAGKFELMDFADVGENFIQAGMNSESFELEQNSLCALNGAVGFVMEKGKATPNFVIITKEKISGISASYLKTGNYPEEKIAAYTEFGGVPEMEGSIIIFGKVTGGFELVKTVAGRANLGYEGVFAGKSQTEIFSVKIN